MEHQPIGLRRQAVGQATVALFVDGDNLPPALSDDILAMAERLGRVDLRRVYAADAGAKGWDKAHGFRVTRVAGAKNGADLLLCIEAVEIACRDSFEVFVIASDDRDFSHLAHWLRERGRHVLGLGTTKSPDCWRAACTEFVKFGEEPSDTHREKPKAAFLSEMDRRIHELILAEGQDGAIEIGRLGARMGSVHKVTLAQLGAANWRAYLKERTRLYALDPQGPTAKVRWIGS